MNVMKFSVVRVHKRTSVLKSLLISAGGMKALILD